MITAKEVVEQVLALNAAGVVYAYGTFGQVLTETLINQKASQTGASVYKWYAGLTTYKGQRVTKKAALLAMCKENPRLRGSDCIGLAKAALWGWRTGPGYVPAQDKSADGMYQTAVAAGCKHGTIGVDAIPEEPGLLLHLGGHAGVYIGNGFAIDIASACQPPTVLKVSAKGWKHWYRCPFVDYSAYDVKPVPVVEEKDEEVEGKRIQTVAEAPKWAQQALSELCATGALRGTDQGLNLSEDMLRTLVVMKGYIDKQQKAAG